MTRFRLLGAAAVVLLALYVTGVAGTSRLTPLGTYNDDACYVLSAREMVAGTFFQHPQPHWPGFSMLLAPVVALFPGSVRALGVTVQLFGLLYAAAWFGIARRFLAPEHALLLAALALLSPTVMLLSGAIMSDVPFAAFAALALLAGGSGRTGFWHAAALGLLAGTAILIRPIGVTITLALILELWPRSRLSAATCGVLSLAPVMVSSAMSMAASGPVSAYAAYVGSHAGVFANLGLWVQQFAGDLASQFLANPSAWPGALLVTLCAIGLMRTRRQPEPRLVRRFLLCYVALYLVWPSPEPRYLIAVWPAVALFAAQALPSSRAVPLGLVALLTLGATSSALQAWEGAHTDSADRYAGYLWLRDHAPPQARILAALDCRAELLSEHPTDILDHVGELADALYRAATRRDTFLVWEGSFGKVDMLGHAQLQITPYLPLWLARSTLVRPVARFPQQLVWQVQVDPRTYVGAYAAYYQGFQLKQAGQSAAAAGSFRRALERCPDFPEARTMLAQVLSDEGHGDEATAEATRVIQQYPMALPAVGVLVRLHPDRAASVIARTSRQLRSLGAPELANEVEALRP